MVATEEFIGQAPASCQTMFGYLPNTVTRGAHHVKDARLTIEDALGHIPGRLA
jgi:hypothetical protein